MKQRKNGYRLRGRHSHCDCLDRSAHDHASVQRCAATATSTRSARPSPCPRYPGPSHSHRLRWHGFRSNHCTHRRGNRSSDRGKRRRNRDSTETRTRARARTGHRAGGHGEAELHGHRTRRKTKLQRHLHHGVHLLTVHDGGQHRRRLEIIKLLKLWLWLLLRAWTLLAHCCG